MRTSPHCQCIDEIKNNLPRTKFCRVPCAAQYQIIENKQEPNMENQLQFNVNDTVTCINTKPLDGNDVAPPLKEGDTYPVKEIHTCSCGKQHLNVGLPLEYNYVRCHACKEEMPITNHWCHPSRFTK